MQGKRQGPAPTLHRCLGLRESITITAGTVIGVGLFTVGANAVGVLGPAVIFATLAALGISIYPSLLYAEMGAALPGAGGTYQYAALGLGRRAGMVAGWNFVISMVAVASGEALAFAFYLKTLLGAMRIALPFDERLLACLAVIGFLVLGVRGVNLTGRMQNGFLFFFWGVTLIWLASMLPHLGLGVECAAVFSVDLSGFLPQVALVWWCFAGFETCCAMGEEIRYPQVNLPRALKLAPYLVFAVTALFQWVLVCVVPQEGLPALVEANAPYAEGLQMAGIVGIPLILLCLGITIGGDFSTLNACVAAPARYVFSMARDGVLPSVFGRLHVTHRTPHLAMLVLGGSMVLLVCTGSIVYIASLSLFATLFHYILGILSAWRLRRRKPELARPYRAPFLSVGAPLSILIYLVMMTQLDKQAVTLGLGWCLLGLLLFQFRQKGMGPLPEAETSGMEAPSMEEQVAMDREYRRWKRVVAAAVLLVLGLYLATFLRGA